MKCPSPRHGVSPSENACLGRGHGAGDIYDMSYHTDSEVKEALDRESGDLGVSPAHNVTPHTHSQGRPTKLLSKSTFRKSSSFRKPSLKVNAPPFAQVLRLNHPWCHYSLYLWSHLVKPPQSIPNPVTSLNLLCSHCDPGHHPVLHIR